MRASAAGSIPAIRGRRIAAVIAQRQKVSANGETDVDAETWRSPLLLAKSAGVNFHSSAGRTNGVPLGLFAIATAGAVASFPSPSGRFARSRSADPLATITAGIGLAARDARGIEGGVRQA